MTIEARTDDELDEMALGACQVRVSSSWPKSGSFGSVGRWLVALCVQAIETGCLRANLSVPHAVLGARLGHRTADEP